MRKHILNVSVVLHTPYRARNICLINIVVMIVNRHLYMRFDQFNIYYVATGITLM